MYDNLNANMETNENGKKKKKSKNPLKKDSLAYLHHREKANARKSKFLNNMTDEQKEIKRAKDREYCRKKKAENKAHIISHLTEREKQALRKQWKKASKKYRDKKKMLANAASDMPPPSDNELDLPLPPSRDLMQRQCGRKRTPDTVQVKSPVPNDAEKQTPRTGRQRHVETSSTQIAGVAVVPLLRSLVRPRGSALPCGPIKVTSGPSPGIRKCQANITLGSDFNPVITRIKSEADPIKQKEDPQSDDTLSLAEDTDQLSDADQPSEDLIPLSNAQVPLSNAPDPLSDVKVEELEVGVDEVEVTGTEDVNRPVEVPTVPLPLHLRQELFLAGNDCYNLIRKQANQIDKLSFRCGKQSHKLRSYVQIVKRRNKKISDLQAEVEALTNFIGELGSEASAIGEGKLGASRIQIQSSNTAVVRKKPNRQLLIVKRDYNRPKSLVGAQPTSDILQKSLLGALDTSDNRQKSPVGVKCMLNIQEKSSVGMPDTADVLQKSKVGVKCTLNIQEKSSVAVQGTSGIGQTSTIGTKRMLETRQKSSVTGQSTSSIPSLVGLQHTWNINIQKSSVGVKCTPDILQKSSSGIPEKSNVLQKSSVGLQRISDTNIQKSPVDCQREIGILQKSAGVKRTSDVLNNPSVAVRPVSVIPQSSPVGFQRTSDIGQNALVIQIDGMHKTVLQPKLVRLDDNSMETG